MNNKKMTKNLTSLNFRDTLLINPHIKEVIEMKNSN